MIRVPAIADETTRSPGLLQAEVTRTTTLYVTSSLLEMSFAKGGYFSPPEFVLNHLAYACLKSCCSMRYEVS